MKLRLVALAALAWVAATAAQAAAVEADAILLGKAERSFSPIRFGPHHRRPAGLRLPPDAPVECRKWGDCDYADKAGVLHAFNPGARPGAWEVVVKTVEARTFKGRPIGALNIGRARGRRDVLANVRAFLGRPLTCSPVGGAINCSAMLGEGWVTLFFTSDGHLIRARIDAYHFT